MNVAVKEYYDKLAPKYDSDRFDNSYGTFIHKQEKRFLRKKLKGVYKRNILDVACGTGRFLDYAKNGLDISNEMLAVAEKKFPDRKLFNGSATELPFEDQSFESIYSFHLMMHLDEKDVVKAVEEARRVLKMRGTYILDFPSKKRRELINYKSKDWHGATSFSIKEIKNLISEDWEIVSSRGVLFLPIHRFPKWIRSLFLSIDNLLCRSFLKEYASYLIVELRKSEKFDAKKIKEVH